MLNPSFDASDPALISANLAQSWKFLSGEDREFKSIDSLTPPQYQEHTYYLPVDVEDAGKRFAVAVLMQTLDATTVASYMFGLDPSQLSESDLNDACGEICNVISSRRLLQLSDQAIISPGTPCYLQKHTYLDTIARGQLEAGYKSTQDDRTLYILVSDLTGTPLPHVQAAVD
jgi:hypothetical protein